MHIHFYLTVCCLSGLTRITFRTLLLQCLLRVYVPCYCTNSGLSIYFTYLVPFWAHGSQYCFRASASCYPARWSSVDQHHSPVRLEAAFIAFKLLNVVLLLLLLWSLQSTSMSFPHSTTVAQVAQTSFTVWSGSRWREDKCVYTPGRDRLGSFRKQSFLSNTKCEMSTNILSFHLGDKLWVSCCLFLTRRDWRSRWKSPFLATHRWVSSC